MGVHTLAAGHVHGVDCASLGCCKDCGKEMASALCYRHVGKVEHTGKGLCRRCRRHRGGELAGVHRGAATPFRRPPVEWSDQAACRRSGVDPDWFTAPRGSEEHEAAKHVCGSCPVRVQCRVDVLATRDVSGMRAGLSGDRRARMLREQNRRAA